MLRAQADSITPIIQDVYEFFIKVIPSLLMAFTDSKRINKKFDLLAF